MYAEHDLLLADTEPSLQMNVSPWQPEIPPFAPLQGVLVASDAVTETSVSASAITARLTQRVAKFDAAGSSLDGTAIIGRML